MTKSSVLKYWWKNALCPNNTLDYDSNVILLDLPSYLINPSQRWVTFTTSSVSVKHLLLIDTVKLLSVRTASNTDWLDLRCRDLGRNRKCEGSRILVGNVKTQENLVGVDYECFVIFKRPHYFFFWEGYFYLQLFGLHRQWKIILHVSIFFFWSWHEIVLCHWKCWTTPKQQTSDHFWSEIDQFENLWKEIIDQDFRIEVK